MTKVGYKVEKEGTPEDVTEKKNSANLGIQSVSAYCICKIDAKRAGKRCTKRLRKIQRVIGYTVRNCDTFKIAN